MKVGDVLSVEEQLKQRILSQYRSIRAFTTEINVPYSTIDTMLKRGISGASVTTVIRVCNALNVDVDALADGILQDKNFNQNLPMGVQEKNILDKYNALDSHGKDLVETILDKEYQRIIQSTQSPKD